MFLGLAVGPVTAIVVGASGVIASVWWREKRRSKTKRHYRQSEAYKDTPYNILWREWIHEEKTNSRHNGCSGSTFFKLERFHWSMRNNTKTENKKQTKKLKHLLMGWPSRAMAICDSKHSKPHHSYRCEVRDVSNKKNRDDSVFKFYEWIV